jgi:2-methylcitrate dehydratase
MDKTTESLVAYARTSAESPLPPAAVDAARNHLVDAVACAIAGYATPPAKVAVQVARTMRSDRTATVLGAGVRSAPPYAVFANTIMVRSLDWNDGMLAPGGGHPSDMIPAILAAAETLDSSGEQVLRAIVLAYEALGSLGATVDRVKLGLDQGLFMGVATAMGVGLLHGLDDQRLANAISLSIVPAIPLHATRRGPLSMWKGAATAAATMNATNMVAFAKAGMTGPAEPFEGEAGVMDVLTGPFELAIPAYPNGKLVVQLSHQKLLPAESHSQAILGVVPRIRAWTSVDEIASIEVEAYEGLVVAIGKHPSVWDPKTRETADHSLPYLLAVALEDGGVTPASFRPERFTDPALRPLMAKVHVRENPEFTARYRSAGTEVAASPRARIAVRTTSGRELVEEVTYPKGHSRNPLTPDDIDGKLDQVCAGVVPDEARERIRRAWWGIGDAETIHGAIATLADFGVGAGRQSTDGEGGGS